MNLNRAIDPATDQNQWLVDTDTLRSRFESLWLWSRNRFKDIYLKQLAVSRAGKSLGQSIEAVDANGYALPFRDLINSYSERLVFVCGECGSGKSILLWGLQIAMEQDREAVTLPFILDFEAATARWLNGSKDNLDESIEELEDAVESHLINHNLNALNIIIDGLDVAARSISTKLEAMRGDKALKAVEYVKRVIDSLLVSEVLRRFRFIVSLDFVLDRADHHEWVSLTRKYDSTSLVMNVLPIADTQQSPEGFDQAAWQLPIYRHAISKLETTQLKKPTKSSILASFARILNSQKWSHVLYDVAIDLERFIELLNNDSREPDEEKRFYDTLCREWTGNWLDLLNERIAKSHAIGLRMSDYIDALLASRWDLASTYGLSNIITALVESKYPNDVISKKTFKYCRLRRTTLKSVKIQDSTFFAVDLGESDFTGATITAEFIAADITDCIWSGADRSRAVFKYCIPGPPRDFEG